MSGKKKSNSGDSRSEPAKKVFADAKESDDDIDEGNDADNVRGTGKKFIDNVTIRDSIMVVKNLPPFSRSDATVWVRMVEAVLDTSEGQLFLERYNNVAGLAYLYSNFSEEDRRDLGWIDLTAVSGSGKSLLSQCLLVWRTADAKVTNAMAKFNLLKSGNVNGNLVDWIRKVYSLEQLIRDNIDVKLLCCEIVASLPMDGQSFCLARSGEFNDWSKFVNLIQQYQSMVKTSNSNDTVNNGNGNSNGRDPVVAAAFADRRARNNRVDSRRGNRKDKGSRRENDNNNNGYEATCFRCGRVGHMKRDCGYDTHKNGNPLDDQVGLVYTDYTWNEVDREIMGNDEYG